MDPIPGQSNTKTRPFNGFAHICAHPERGLRVQHKSLGPSLFGTVFCFHYHFFSSIWWVGSWEGGWGRIWSFFSIKVLPRIGPSKSLDPSTYPTGDSKSWMSLQTPRQVSRPLYLFCQSLDVGCLQGGDGVLSEGPGTIHTGSLDLEPVIPRAEEIVLATQGADLLNMLTGWHTTESVSDWLLKKKTRYEYN